MPTRQTNLVWADVTRILAILLVIILHTVSVSQVSAAENIISVFIRVMAKVCVPLFIMLSGALLLPKQESWATFFQKRLRRVLVPWLFWTLIALVVFSSGSLSHPLSMFAEFKRLFSAEFTFLPLIFSLYLLIPPLQVIVRHGQRKYVLYLLGLWLLAIGFLPYVRNTLAFPLSVDNGLVTQTIKFSGYLLGGWWLSTIKLKSRHQWLGLIIFGLGMSVWSTLLELYHGNPDSVYSAYTSPWIITASMISFVLLVNLDEYFNQLKPSIKKALEFLSQISFGVFLVHAFVKQLIMPLLLGTVNSLLQSTVLWLGVTVVSFSLIVVLSRIKILGRIVT